MLICNCTLAGTLACRNCSEYIKYFGTSPEVHYYQTELPQQPLTWYYTNSYDSDRYELVEKKDWKINQLEERLNSSKKELEGCNAEIQYNMIRKGNILISIDEIEKELKELKGLES